MYALTSTPFQSSYLYPKLLLVLVDTRVKKGKRESRRKKNACIDTIEIWLLITATSSSFGVLREQDVCQGAQRVVSDH